VDEESLEGSQADEEAQEDLPVDEESLEESQAVEEAQEDLPVDEESLEGADKETQEDLPVDEEKEMVTLSAKCRRPRGWLQAGLAMVAMLCLARQERQVLGRARHYPSVGLPT
jgi:hypothetical protein